MADSGPGLPQGTVTFLFTDIEGSTALARQLRADWGRVRNEHHVLRRAIERHGPGRLVDPTARHLGTVAFRCVTLCDGAEPGQILVSHATEALLEGDGADISLRDLGERTLQDLDHAVHVYEVTD